MSNHEKEKEQEDAYTKIESLITPSLHLCFDQNCCFVCYKLHEANQMRNTQNTTYKNTTTSLHPTVALGS